MSVSIEPHQLGLSLTGYGPSLFGNRLVRTRMPGGVWRAGEKNPRLSDWEIPYLVNMSTPSAVPMEVLGTTPSLLVFRQQLACSKARRGTGGAFELF